MKKNQGNQSAGDRLPNAALCDSSMCAPELARRLGLLPGDKTGTRAREGVAAALWGYSWGYLDYWTCEKQRLDNHISRICESLIARGWIAVHEPGGFTRKMRHATAYRLENEPGAAPGATARKGYMRWQPRESDEKTR